MTSLRRAHDILDGRANELYSLIKEKDTEIDKLRAELLRMRSMPTQPPVGQPTNTGGGTAPSHAARPALPASSSFHSNAQPMSQPVGHSQMAQRPPPAHATTAARPVPALVSRPQAGVWGGGGATPGPVVGPPTSWKCAHCTYLNTTPAILDPSTKTHKGFCEICEGVTTLA